MHKYTMQTLTINSKLTDMTDNFLDSFPTPPVDQPPVPVNNHVRKARAQHTLELGHTSGGKGWWLGSG